MRARESFLLGLITGLALAGPTSMAQLKQSGADSAAAGNQTEKTTATLRRPDLSGQVRAGGTFPRATVFIFTAGPRVGTSTFCPSCYADCRKSAKTDSEGAFKIESLDPQLLFRILVVAKGYKPQFVTKVDPAVGPITVELEPVAFGALTPDRSIRGQVVDVAGKPIVGAVVESHGIRRKNAEGAMWGSLPGVDPLAVTDERGEFQIAAQEPFFSLDVRVEAGTYANKTFSNLTSGTSVHKLTLTEGATVKGRVLSKGQPLPLMAVGMVSVDRGMENFTGNFEIGTDREGRFAFVNLPPNVDYYIYGLMGTLQGYGAIPARAVRVGADGTTLDVGDLVAESGQRLSGRVVCSDGEPVPAETRLLISREQAWDSIQVTLDKYGGFDASGLPRETISLSARIPGYHISAKNLSLDTMNPFRLIGRLDHDVTNLVFLLEKGLDLGPQTDVPPSESDLPQNQALRGAEAKPDHANQWFLSGLVRDARTKQAVARFQVTCGNMQGFGNRTSWDERNRTEGSNGEFQVYLSKRYTQPALRVEADNYLPKRFILQPDARTNLDLELEPGMGPAGTVVLPDGKPAQGVSLALLCDGAQEVGLDGSGGLRAWRHKELISLTDPDGSFVLKPLLDMDSIVVASKEGFKITPVNDLATNSKIILEAWGKVMGVLHRAAHPSTNEPVDLTLQDYQLLNLQQHTITDSEGRFTFEHVPPGRLQINGRNMVNANGWTWDPLQKVTLKPGEELTIDIQAPAKSAPAASIVPGIPAPRPKLLAGPGPQGVVLLPSGEPAADAEVALLVPSAYIALGKATFKAYEARQQGLVVRADARGHFTLPSVEGAGSIVSVHERGFAEMELGDFKPSVPIKLQAWGRIEGTLRVGRRLGTNELVVMQSPALMSSGVHLNFDSQEFQARTDERGKFRIDFVPPGERLLARMIPTGEGSWQHSAPTAVTVVPGVPTSVVVGGTGQTVQGKLRVSQPNFAWTNARASIHPPLPASFRKVRSAEEQRAWSAGPEAKQAMKGYRAYPVELAADGSFQAQEVLPGKYELDIMVMSENGIPARRLLSRSRCELIVPEPARKDDPSPVDLGTLEAKLESVDPSRPDR